MIGLYIILAHLAGDYLFQSNWMSQAKTSRWWPAIAHGLTYTIPYAIFVHSAAALFIICATHIVIDHYRLAKYVVWFKNFLAPKGTNPSWESSKATGYPPETPAWLAVWLMIIADNTIHLAINTAAIVAFTTLA